MITEGQIVLFKFPQTDQKNGKLRPVLVLRKLPGKFDDWLICMISSRHQRFIPDFDEVINAEDSDFLGSGLKIPSVIRISRLAVVDRKILLGRLGQIDQKRLLKIRQRLTKWINISAS